MKWDKRDAFSDKWDERLKSSTEKVNSVRFCHGGNFAYAASQGLTGCHSSTYQLNLSRFVLGSPVNGTPPKPPPTHPTKNNAQVELKIGRVGRVGRV